MAYRYGNRPQSLLFPKSIEEYVAHDAPVRAYDAFVEALDFSKLGIELDPRKVGNSEYDPKAMLKLLVYGYSYGLKGSRKLERAVHNDLSFVWLMGGLKPDHKTIAEFRRKNKKAIKEVLKQCARLCIKLNLVDGNILFVDGTKIRGNAGRNKSHNKAHYEKQLSKVDQKIDQLLKDCEKIDIQEEHKGSLVSMNKELANSEKLKSKIKQILQEFETKDWKQINQTDPDCRIMSSIQGKHTSYNVQVDDKNGLIIQAEAVTDTSDLNQFANQINQANEILDKPCQIACADAGYANTTELEKIDAQEIKVIVPSQRQALKNKENPFSKHAFTYNEDQDYYICPEGHKLKYMGTDKGTERRHYQIPNPKTCHSCPHYGICTPSRKGRKVVRLPNETMKQKLETQYEQTASQEVYKKRKQYAEYPFGHIKRNLKTDAFMLRGIDGVQAETSILATCFNIARMITTFGVTGLIKAFGRVPALS